MLASEILKQIYEQKLANGLLSVNVAFSPQANEASFEELCAELVALEEAILVGNISPLEFGDYSWT